jgi:MFS family permease
VSRNPLLRCTRAAGATPATRSAAATRTSRPGPGREGACRFRADRAEEYRKLRAGCDEPEAEPEENDVKLRKLVASLERIRKLDFHDAPSTMRCCGRLIDSQVTRVLEAREGTGKRGRSMSDVAHPPPDRWLNRTVAGAGLTSALGDFCYETTTVILPGFLAVLGIPAALLGLIEGVADAVASFTKMVSGFIADRFGHRKALVLIGYGLTPCGQALIALASGWGLILVGRIVSWFGKGLRGPLRDAIVVQSISPATRGRAFGFHRAMDTIGAILGPTLGVALLGWAQTLPSQDEAGPFRLVFWLTLIPGALAVLAFLTLVRDPEHSPNPALRMFSTLRGLPPRFRRYLAAVGLFGAGDFSHSLLILAATGLLTPGLGVIRAAQVAGLLYVWRNTVQAAASFPVGALADRVGHQRVLVAGYVLGVVTAGLTAVAFANETGTVAPLVVIFTTAGLCAAVQEAIESTVTAGMVSAETLATSYGALGTVNGAARFVSTAATGFVWTAASPVLAFSLAALTMAAGTLALSRIGREAA